MKLLLPFVSLTFIGRQSVTSTQVPGDRCVTKLASEARLADALPGIFAEAIDTAWVDLALITSGPSVAGLAPALIRLSAETILLVAALHEKDKHSFTFQIKKDKVF